jgi:hypothetical protein
MRKLILIFGVLFCLNNVVKAQAYSGQAGYNKNMISAAINEMPYEESTVDAAVAAKFKSMGYSSSKASDDFLVFKAVKLPQLGPDTYDLYFKTDRKSKKEKGRTVVYMLISKGSEVFISEAADTVLFANAKTFLNNLITDVAAADLEVQIAAQAEIVKKANKKLNNLTDDGQDLAKKQAKINQQIADNKNDTAKQQAELASQTQILETLKAKRTQ